MATKTKTPLVADTGVGRKLWRMSGLRTPSDESKFSFCH